jgi:glutamine amidotransferase
MFSTMTTSVAVSNRAADIRSATHIVLPGVGAFGAAMEKIKSAIPLDVLQYEIMNARKPFLGICVGMQVLADRGLEFGEHKGLGWIPGVVEKLETGDLPLPHVGWNSLSMVKPIPFLDRFASDPDFYFVHSYAFKEKNPEHVLARTDYGGEFSSVIGRDSILGVQFHPEKSQVHGRILLENFLAL